MLRLVVPVALGLLLMISLMMTSQIMVQGTAVEKENKVVEVLLSAANPDEILAGKLLGLGLSGLLQVMVWFSMAFAGSLMFAAALAGMGFELPWAAVGVGIVLFIAAYLFLGSLMLGTGSLGNNLRESQQYNMVWTLLTVFPMVVISILMADPHGTFGRVMTWIPFTAPLTIILRMTLQPSGIAWWEIAGPILVLLLATWFSIRLGARLFRVGLLLSGNRPSFREILRQARLQ